MYSLPNEIVFWIFCFNPNWKFLFSCNKLVSVQKLDLFCQTHMSNQIRTVKINLIWDKTRFRNGYGKTKPIGRFVS